MTKLQLFIEGVEVDLFKDEIVTVNSSVANVQDISKVFSDFSQSFLVPASPRNNAIFEHWYESDVVPTIDQNLRRDAFIEIETMPFRVGKIQLNEAVIKDGQVVSYSLNFFGALTSLKDRFGELTLKDLDYSTIAHTYSGTEVYNRVTDGTTAYDVRYPLIAPRRVWTFGDASTQDITTNSGSVKWFELFPAIKVAKIFDIIETQFGITFNGTFFSSTRWTDLYIRYQNVEEFVFLTNYELIDYNSTTPSNTFFNTIDNTLTYSYVPIAGLTFHETTLSFSSVSDGTATIYCEAYVNGILYATYESYGGTNPLILTKEANIPGLNSVVTYQFKADKTVSFDVDVLYQNPSGTIYTGFGNTISLTSTLNASILAPNLKIADFVSAIFKAFNLVCVGENETTFTIEPLQDWYNSGGEKDITKHVINSSSVKRLPLYKQIAFKYKESKSFLNKNFSALFNRQYGDLDYSFEYDGTEFKIELPFENIQFAELETSNLFCTFLIEENQSAYVPEPLLLYLGGEETATTFKFFDGSSYLNVTDYALFNSVNTTGFSLCFGNEFNIVTQETEPNSLYQTYYANHLGNLYDLQQRLFSFTAMLPTGVLANLKMNDKIIIKDKRYLINDISSTLNNGEVKMNLIRELVTIAPDCECIKVTYTLVGEEPVTVEVESSGTGAADKNFFDFFIGDLEFRVFWQASEIDKWHLINQSFPFYEATLSEDTECPFGTFTIEEGSIFESFEVEPCY
jgi:hypothetical protein